MQLEYPFCKNFTAATAADVHRGDILYSVLYFQFISLYLVFDILASIDIHYKIFSFYSRPGIVTSSQCML